MSKSLKRVRAALEAAGFTDRITETTLARTAQDAANAVGCDVDQIAKSIIFQTLDPPAPVLFLTAGGNQVDADKAATLVGAPLGRADAKLVRDHTGFAIGGVSPVGHLAPCPVWIDPRLFDFDVIWAAAGTPLHVFKTSAAELVHLTGAVKTNFTKE